MPPKLRTNPSAESCSTLSKADTRDLSSALAQTSRKHGWDRKALLAKGCAILLAGLTAGLLGILLTRKPRLSTNSAAIPVRLAHIAESYAEHPAAAGASSQSVAPQLFPWDIPSVKYTLCTDTCTLQSNGVCDDGRGGQGMVGCDLGTDCTDCGRWDYQQPASAINWQPPQPVELLRAKGIEVRVRHTATPIPFLMPYTDPQHDVDVSAQLDSGSTVELGLTQLWHTRLAQGCHTAADGRALVLDVGANFGWYSLFAASLGCRVIAWEPVPHFRAFLTYAMQLNRVEHLIDIRPCVVADQTGETYNLTVPQRGIWGTASVNGGNIDRSVDNQGEYQTVIATGERVDAVVQEDVLLLKIDVEGFEPAVFESSKGILDNHQVSNVFLEYSPGVYERQQRWAEYTDMPRMLMDLVAHKFTILHIRDEFTRRDLLGRQVEGQLHWDRPLPIFEQVTEANLQADLADAVRLQGRTLGCPAPQELQRFPHWAGCNAIPEDLNPKSFRACFGHNTNVWATTDREGLQVGPPVGVVPLNCRDTDWFIPAADPDEALGIGLRPCKDLPVQVLVRHRCPCTRPAVCGEEARLVEQLARSGKLSPMNS